MRHEEMSSVDPETVPFDPHLFAVWAYIKDLAGQHMPESGVVAILDELAADILKGEHVEAHRCGELDDLLDLFRQLYTPDQGTR